MHLVWNVYFYEFNKGQVVVKNIFDWSNFKRDVLILLKDKQTKEDFSTSVRECALYYFWGKNEYEVNICPTENCHKFNYKELKIDFFKQLELNWDQFISYIWAERENYHV